MPFELRPFGNLFAEPTRNGLTRPKAVRGAGVKMVNMGELFAFPRLRNAPMDRVPLSESETEKSHLQEGDLLFARQSLVLEGAGKCTIFLEDDEPVTFESHITRVRLNKSEADPLYYFYYFQSPKGRAAIRSIVEQGAGAAGIRGSDLKSLQVEWRDVEEQSEIAEILSSLDDKIELNCRMNETLEAIARAIFRSWFVDFDPVRAKASGEPPESICRRLGLTPDLLALFPDGFQDSELGEIPEGWKVRPVGEVVQVVGGSTPSTKIPEYWEGGTYNWATPKDLSGLTAPVLLETERKITELGLKQISSGLLPAGTLLLSSRAPIGYLAISDVPVAVNQGFIAILCEDPLSPHYMLNWCHFNMVSIKQRAGGTTFAEISKSAFRPIQFIVPSTPILISFSNIAKPLYKLIAEHCRENASLGDMRDMLLPRLISGELPVPPVKA